MPVTKGTYAAYERDIYHQLLDAGLNTAAACGVLANLQAESGFNPINLQNSYESSLGYTDKSYTDAVDRGTYTNFVYDKAGYGIAQWTYWSRKKGFLSYARDTKKKSIGDLGTQVEYLIKELKSDFKSLWTYLTTKVENSAQGAYDAGYEFCRDFERPANTNAPVTRGNTARNDYWAAYGDNPVEAAMSIPDIGSLIVEKALLEIENQHSTDGSSLIYKAYTEAGVPIPDLSARNYYIEYKDTARHVSLEDIAPGDLVFYRLPNGNMTVSIYAGDRSLINVNAETTEAQISFNVGTPSVILRLLSDAQVSPEVYGDDGSAIDFSSLAIIDPYNTIIGENLSRVEANGYDYGYLFDVSHSEGGSFRFYIPEFTEHAGANWSNVEIRGRSVDILSYEYTNSRVVTINLDLYAGAGLYEGIAGQSLEDAVDKLHKDVNFVKSLEYPDYSDVVVRPPATVHLILGAALDMIGVVSEVSIEHLKPLDRYNRSAYIKLSFTVTQIAANPPDYKDIRDGSYTITGTSNIDSVYSGGETTVSRAPTNAPVFSNRGEVRQLN